MSKFSVGQMVEKITGDYGGPGVVRGVIEREDGRLRYLVGHRIGDGYGEFLHVYAVGNLRALDDPELDSKLKRVDDAIDNLRDPNAARLKRVDAAVAQQLSESIQKNSRLANRVTALRSALATLKEGLIAAAAIPDYCNTVLDSDDPEH